MDNVSSAVLLCMAGLRGTVLSRLPSGGITHLHRYYPAIRLPVYHLSSFVGCWTYHRSALSMEHTGSPQLTRCPCTTWLTFDPVVPRAVLPKRHPRVAFRPLNSVGTPNDYFGAVMPYDPVVSLSTLDPQRYRCVSKTRFWWLVRPFQTGFPPVLHHALSWAH